MLMARPTAPRRTFLQALALTALSPLAVACATKLQTAGSASLRPLVYVAIGASDAVGVGASDPAKTGWVPLLMKRLPEGKSINLGISGARIADSLEQQLPIAVDLQPDLIFVWMAVNDLIAQTPLETYQHDLDALIGTLEQETSAAVFVANVPDLSALPSATGLDPAHVSAQVRSWNAVIATCSEAHQAHLVDLATGWKEQQDNQAFVSADGFHPSDEGYARISDLFYRSVLDSSTLPRARK